ncbi:BA14K family protein [Kaistia dalseonensis]|uniref:Lectin-like protein BA14k n=1 Tax=Kaistia dalseonensis TaxID=410840 RepID=A0ABU0HBM3_9HYPH|nr:BA14K family protein [Kaistia dalseonensis]MCX5497076.1 BA14K family protein [Kaistia dalseonensis]MDQ0439702.1 hypothetical protein [Kaistia dalseonensis]
MKSLASIGLAAVLGVTAIVGTTGDASAQWYGRGGPGWGGPGWGGPGWHGGPPPPPPGGGYYYRGPRYYGGWYGNPGAAAAAGAIVGLGLGAAIASQPSYGYEVPPPRGVAWRNHVSYCEDRYRSYNPSTDTFIGYDGRAYRCVGSY